MQKMSARSSRKSGLRRILRPLTLRSWQRPLNEIQQRAGHSPSTGTAREWNGDSEYPAAWACRSRDEPCAGRGTTGRVARPKAAVPHYTVALDRILEA